MEAIGEARLAGEAEDVGGPGLGFANGGGGEKNRDVGCPRHNDILNGGIAGRDKVGGVGFQSGMLELADDDSRIREDLRDAVEEKLFRSDAMGRLHGSGRENDHARGTEFFCDAKRDGTAHGVSGEDGARGIDHAASGEPPDERSGAGLGLRGEEGARGAAMAGKVRYEDTQALLGKGAGDVIHDDVVGGNTVEEDDGAEIGVGGQVFAFNGEHLHAAGGGVNDVAFFGIAARGEIDEAAADDETKNTDKSESALTSVSQRKRSPKKSPRLAVIN